jgi:DNA-directed RNA polymerase subunit beta
MAQELTTGVPFASPVFDGRRERNPHMLQLAFPEDVAPRRA